MGGLNLVFDRGVFDALGHGAAAAPPAPAAIA